MIHLLIVIFSFCSLQHESIDNHTIIDLIEQTYFYHQL